MPTISRRYVGLAAVCCAALFITGCTPDAGSPDDETPSPSLSETLTPPDLQDFTDRAELMADWTDTCAALDLTPVFEQFAGAEPADIRPGQANLQANATWGGSCVADADGPQIGASQNVYVIVDAFDTNVLAFEYYHDDAKWTAESFSTDAVDEELDLGSDSSWQASRITAQETPTDQSEQRVVSTAALLGDFYTVTILVRFRPNVLEQAECESATTSDCVMTATSMAEFLANSGYLEELHTSIETSIDGGV
jgi:hypothetical protein